MKAQKIRSISIPQIKEAMPADGLGDDILVFSGRKIYDSAYGLPLRLEGMSVSLCTAGDGECWVQGKEYKITPGSMCIKTPGTLGFWNNLSADYNGFEMILSMNFVKKLPFDLKNISTAFAYLREDSLFRLTEKQQQDFIHLFLLIQGLSVHPGHYRSQSLEGIVVSLLYFVCDLIRQTEEDFEKGLNHYQSKDRKHYYLLNFLELLGQYSHQERSITFYADKMFLTPKYFSTVIKEVSGKSAGDWIDEYVMMEAKALLQHSESNISETAYQLNFPNASFFGRYFKKHSGMSPGDYRKSYAFQ